MIVLFSLIARPLTEFMTGTISPTSLELGTLHDLKLVVGADRFVFAADEENVGPVVLDVLKPLESRS